MAGLSTQYIASIFSLTIGDPNALLEIVCYQAVYVVGTTYSSIHLDTWLLDYRAPVMEGHHVEENKH